MQYVFIVLILSMTTVIFLLTYWLFISNGSKPYLFVLGFALLLFVSALVSPRFWQKWVVFAADRRGIYIGNIHFLFTFVPWGKVGKCWVDYGWSGSDRVKAVFLELKITNDEFSKLLQRNHVFIARNSCGSSVLGLPNMSRNPEKNREQIENIRNVAICNVVLKDS